MRRLIAILALALVTGGAPAAGAGTPAGRADRAARARVTRTAGSRAGARPARDRSRRSPGDRTLGRHRLVIDVGGEGRLPHALNLNPGRLTSTTGKPGRPIPRLVQGAGEQMPFPAQVADEIRLENAPLRRGAAGELARVIKPGGRIVLRHPEGYAAEQHGEVIRRVGGTHQQRTVGGMTITIIRAPSGVQPAQTAGLRRPRGGNARRTRARDVRRRRAPDASRAR